LIRSNRRSREAWTRALLATSSIAANPARLLPDIIEDLAAKQGSAPALLSEASSLTYSELADAANRYSRWALENVTPGEIVGLIMPNRPEYVGIWLGITRVGGIVALVNTNLVGPSLEHAIASVSPKHVIVASELEQMVREAIPGAGFRIWVREEEHFERYSDASLPPSDRPSVTIRDTALLIYTSGTTGLPKAAKVSHHRILQWSLWFAGLGDFSPADRMYNCLPLYHSVGGVVAVGSVLSAGGSVVIAERLSVSRFWPDVFRFKCTLFQYIGELCRYLVNASPCPEERKHALRLCCGNGLRADVWKKFKERFSIPHIIEFYAASEGTFSLFNIEDEPGAIGHVPPFLRPNFPAVIVRYDAERDEPHRDENGRCVRCVPNETGEALGRISGRDNPDARFEGYMNAAETEKKILRNVFEEGDAWYRTGDLMRMDERGFIYFADRIGDTFRWKGENVSTAEVEQALSSCPGVLEIIVYGVTVPYADGRAGMAAIVVDETFDPASFHQIARERLPSYARPLFVRVCSSIPVTETFKPKKRVLIEEGFTPEGMADQIYVEDRAKNRYVRVHKGVYDYILSGEIRS
jgi:fatty-acyl-CoA synthase